MMYLHCGRKNDLFLLQIETIQRLIIILIYCESISNYLYNLIYLFGKESSNGTLWY